MNYQQNYTNAIQQPMFSPTQQQSQFINIALNNPPCVVPYSGIQEIMREVPFVTAAVAMKIQNSANVNALRMYMFNQCGSNYFQNQFFVVVVNKVLDLATLYFTQRQINTLEDAIKISIDQMTELCCAVNVREDNALQAFVDNATIQVVRTAIDQHDQLINQIIGMKQRLGGGMPQQQIGIPQQQPYQQNNRQMNSAPSSNGLFISDGSGRTNLQNAGGVASHKYNDSGMGIQQPFNGRQPAPAPIVQNNERAIVSSVKNVLASISKIDWTPTKDNYYYPAFNPYTHDLYYTIDSDGKIIDSILNEKAEKIMDYARHSISTVFGPKPKGADFSNVSNTLNNISLGAARLNAAIEELNEKDPEEEIDPKYNALIKQDLVAETSLHEAWIIGDIAKIKAAKEGKVPFVYRAYACICEPFVSSKDENEFVKRISEMKTLTQLKNKLDATYDECNIEMWSAINKRMTATVNRILKQNMSIPNVSIDSFVEDIHDLINHLSSKYGENVRDIFLKYQTQYIADTVASVSSDIAEIFTEGMLDNYTFEEDEEVPKFTYMSCYYSLTYLNCTAHELEIELCANTSSLVTKSKTPIMYDIINSVFADNCTTGEFSRYLIKTNDGRIMECCKGILNNNPVPGDELYLLSLID